MPSSDSQEIPTEKLYDCLHEAGHVVAARAHGFPVAWVSIDQEFISAQGGDRKGNVQVLGPVSMAICSPVINPIMRRKKMSEPDDKKNVRGYCVQVLAGPMAEQRYNPSFDMAVARLDRGQVETLITRIIGRRSERVAFFNSVVQAAMAFVEANHGTIFNFAMALHNRRTILENDIDPLIASAREHAALGASPQ